MRLCEQLSLFFRAKLVVRASSPPSFPILPSITRLSYKVITPAQALELFGARVARLEGDTVSPFLRRTKSKPQRGCF